MNYRVEVTEGWNNNEFSVTMSNEIGHSILLNVFSLPLTVKRLCYPLGSIRFFGNDQGVFSH